MMSRCVPYRMFETSLCVCVAWIMMTTICWSWFLWSGREQMAPLTTTMQQDIPLSFKPLNIKHAPVKMRYPRNVTPVYIVEEHHEVLPYWYNAANRGLIPKKGNTLFHIDAHPDSAPPENYPPFRFPVSEQEIRQMMQHNDAFIFSSVMIGFFNRWIYVRSSWDDEQNDGDYQSSTITIGTLKSEPLNSTEPVCRCYSVLDSRVDLKCFHLKGFRGMDQEGEIDPKQCDIKASYVIEILSESKARELLETKTWLTEDEHVVLDIDEDFYGCEAACMPLYNAGIDETQIQKFKMISGNVFCPRNTIQERMVDKLFQHLIIRLAALNLLPSNSTPEKQEQTNIRKTVMAELYQSMSYHGIRDVMCLRDYNKSMLFLKSFTKHLMNYTADQLTALGEVGLCLHTTPKSINFYPREGIRLCDGYNRPGETAVVFHTPTLYEVNERTVTLRNILKRMPDPDIVTVCRSMRDGYTPRKFFHKIEADVLESLTDIFPKINSDSIHYDRDLLGGRFGWPDRHSEL